jgi:HSP20 family protein
MALELWRHRGMGRPFRELARMEREMGDLFGRFFQDWPGAGLAERGRAWAPAVDMIDRPDEVVVRADLPGLEQKDVDVTIQEGMLTIRGERKEEREEKKEGQDYYCSERAFGAFVRSMPLPPGVDPEKVKATFKNGILEVHLQKSKESKGKKIEIKAE